MVKKQTTKLPQKTRNVALLLAILLGGFGLLYSYREDKVSFWLFLVSVIFLFWTVIIPFIWWIIAIMKVIQRDEDFYLNYYK